MEVVVDLNLNVVELDTQKVPFYLTHAVKMLMVEKVELDHPVSELKRTLNLLDSVKPCYQL
jgi:hypothetical protein